MKFNSKKRVLLCVLAIGLVVALIVGGCAGSPGERGPAGPPGERGPSGPSGEAATATVFAIRFNPDEPGCGGVCHEAVAPYIVPNPEGKYTLAYEANHAWEGHDLDPLGELQTLNDCLACHAAGTGDRAGKGNVSSKALREIVHRVHLTSEHFTVELDGEERQGDCFTCHVMSGPSTTGLY